MTDTPTNEPSDRITGQLMFASRNVQTEDGRQIVMVIGMLAVPEGSPFNVEGEKFNVTGSDVLNEWAGQQMLNFSDETETVKQYKDGWRADQLLCHPIWRIW